MIPLSNLVRLFLFNLVLQAAVFAVLSTASTSKLTRTQRSETKLPESKEDSAYGVQYSSTNVLARNWRGNRARTRKTVSEALFLSFHFLSRVADTPAAASTCKMGISDSSVEVSYKNVATGSQWTPLKILNITSGIVQ